MIITNHQPWAVALNGKSYDRNQKEVIFWNGPINLTNTLNVSEVLRRNLVGKTATVTDDGVFMIKGRYDQTLDTFLDNMVKAESVSPTLTCLVIDHDRKVETGEGLFSSEILEFRFLIPRDSPGLGYGGSNLFKLRKSFKDEFAKLTAE